MKLRAKLLISILFGLCAALSMADPPMWWGVIFSTLSEPLTTAPLTADAGGWFSLQLGDIAYRFKTLDLLFSFLHSS